ncbi:conserved hypothetical protein [Ricinus communis]|uniref:Uncharacterized protein n=1 Tax=Ricinus communis TaxID=3988 RepID=B9SD72_RICCO|nr:conserved hypothetical protein [Ricinus communis]
MAILDQTQGKKRDVNKSHKCWSSGQACLRNMQFGNTSLILNLRFPNVTLVDKAKS